jgi:hypothetical protein
MPGGKEFGDAALWRRWREGQAASGEAAAEPDALVLAAYAENRLGRPGIDPEDDPAIAAVEAWFVDCPAALDDVVAARSSVAGSASAALVARAQSLIAQPDEKVWPLPLVSARPSWRSAAAWSGIAASMIVAVLIGFQLGRYNIMDLPDSGQNPSIEQAVIGTPGTILATDDEDTGI